MRVQVSEEHTGDHSHAIESTATQVWALWAAQRTGKWEEVETQIWGPNGEDALF